MGLTRKVGGIFITVTKQLFSEVILCIKKQALAQQGQVHLHAAAPASASKERRLKAAVEDEHDEEDEEEEDDPPSSERVRRAGGIGSRGFGKS